MKGSERKLMIKLRTAAVRTSQKEQGMFDGRFATRSEESKKAYNRKTKHRRRDEEG
ncbi:MAG: hypothetical protein ACK45H_07135 [Bacteroidota bacterium]|jgi:hypothetical protein